MEGSYKMGHGERAKRSRGNDAHRQLRAGSSTLQWTEKYAPTCRQQLLVRKNKVQEFADWLQASSPQANRLCILSGNSGCGKSTLIKVMAAECGLDIVEYVSKIQQHRGNDRLDLYESKLETFESFCSRAWMPALASAPTKNVRGKASLVVLDDVPTVVGEDQERRLIHATLGLVARSTKVVLSVTEISSKDSNEHYAPGKKWETSSVPRSLLQTLEKTCGPVSISLNPIPKATMVKHLARIVSDEFLSISKEDLQSMAEHSQGDLSSAVLGLQFAARGLKGRAVGRSEKAARRSAADPSLIMAGNNGTGENDKNHDDSDFLSRMGKDTSLSLFHGLGKLLYNKRIQQREPNNIQYDDLHRDPMDGFDPESTVFSSGLSGPSVTAFLHENILAFIDEDYMGDIWQCLEHLSLADVLATGLGSMPYYGTSNGEPDGIRGMQDMLASIVASRGVCFWNAHPAPRSWKPLKAPVSFKVQHSIRSNADRLRVAASINRVDFGGARSQASYCAMSTEILPYVRAMGYKEVHQQPRQWERYWQGSSVLCDNWAGGRCPPEQAGMGVDVDEDPIEN
jgi:hypothetical protein